MRAGGPRSRIGLGAAALDRVAFGAPAQHPAGQVGDILEAGLLQDVCRVGRAAAGPAHRDDRPVAREFAGALREVAERDQDRIPDVTERDSAAASPPWKSVRPAPRIIRQSPVKAMLRSSSTKVRQPLVWPGVGRTISRRPPNPTTSSWLK